MSSSTSAHRGIVTGCVEFAELFQHPLLEEPPTASAPVDIRRRAAGLQREAESLCRVCPLMRQCLYSAVVRYDVAGYVAASTQKERTGMRAQLGVRVGPEEFDTLAGVTRQHRQVNHDEVIRLRRSNPQESLDQLAQRLGCSLSTVKRHLRHERRAPADSEPGSSLLPTEQQVVAAHEQVTATPRASQRAAA